MGKPKRKPAQRRQPERIEITTLGPTEEQAARFQYEDAALVEDGTVQRERVYRRVPHVVTMARAGTISDSQATALGWYRDRWDRAQYSATVDSLGRLGPRSGGGDYERWRTRILDAEADVRRAETAVGSPLVATLRAIALEDYSAAQVARQRWTGGVNSRCIKSVVDELRRAADLLQDVAKA